MRDYLLYVRKGLDYLVNSVEIVLFITVFIVVLCQIFWRYVLNNPLVWSEELSRFIYIWISLIGWAQATRSNSHIRIDFIYNRLPAPLRVFLGYLYKVMIIGFLGLLAYLGWDIAMRQMGRPSVSIPEITAGMVYLVLPISGVICILYVILDMLVPNRREEPKVMD